MCRDWGREYVPGAAPVSGVPDTPLRARVWRGSAGGAGLRLAGRDTSWSSVTRAVGVCQAQPLSVVGVTVLLCPPAGSVGPIRVSREITYLSALLWEGTSNGLYPNY
jgi:hypothetical protein